MVGIENILFIHTLISFYFYSITVFVIIFHVNLVVATKHVLHVKGKNLAKKTLHLDSVSDFDDIVEPSNEQFDQDVLNNAPYIQSPLDNSRYKLNSAQKNFLNFKFKYPLTEIKKVKNKANVNGEACNPAENMFRKVDILNTKPTKNNTARPFALKSLPERIMLKRKYRTLPKYNLQPFIDYNNRHIRKRRKRNNKILQLSEDILEKQDSLNDLHKKDIATSTEKSFIKISEASTTLLTPFQKNTFLKLAEKGNVNPLAWEDSFLKGIYKNKEANSNADTEKNKRCIGNCKSSDAKAIKKPKPRPRSFGNDDILNCLEHHLNQTWCLIHRLYHTASSSSTYLTTVKPISKNVEDTATVSGVAANQEVTMQKAIATPATVTLASLPTTEEATSKTAESSQELISTDCTTPSQLLNICPEFKNSTGIVDDQPTQDINLLFANSGSSTVKATLTGSNSSSNILSVTPVVDVPVSTTPNSLSTTTTQFKPEPESLGKSAKKSTTHRKRSSVSSDGVVIPVVRRLEQDLVLIEELQKLLNSLKEINVEERAVKKNQEHTTLHQKTSTTTTTTSTTECCSSSTVAPNLNIDNTPFNLNNSSKDIFNQAKLAELIKNSSRTILNSAAVKLHYPKVNFKTNTLFEYPTRNKPVEVPDSPALEMSQINNVLQNIHDIFGGTLIHLQERNSDDSDYRLRRNHAQVATNQDNDKVELSKSKRFLFHKGKKTKNKRKKVWKKLHGRELELQPFLGKTPQNFSLT